MPVLEVDVQKLVDLLKNELNVEDLKSSAQAIKKGWDWNPFDKDEDEYATAWSEFKNNLDLLQDFLQKVVFAVEKASKSMSIVEGGAKLEAAVKFADEIIKLPFWFEWLDDKVLRLLFSILVSKTNDKLGHDWSVSVNI